MVGNTQVNSNIGISKLSTTAYTLTRKTTNNGGGSTDTYDRSTWDVTSIPDYDKLGTKIPYLIVPTSFNNYDAGFHRDYFGSVFVNADNASRYDLSSGVLSMGCYTGSNNTMSIYTLQIITFDL